MAFSGGLAAAFPVGTGAMGSMFFGMCGAFSMCKQVHGENVTSNATDIPSNPTRAVNMEPREALHGRC